jgi:dynein heavy chain
MNLAKKKYPTEYEESMNTVFTMELIRFNGLTTVIKDSLRSLEKAVRGLTSMTTVLEQTLHSLFDGKVPATWKANSYPSLKPLGSYISDLKLRLDFFREWFSKGSPSLYNISRFFFTQSFLTGVR